MPETIDIKRLIDDLPTVDRECLDELHALLERLREQGVATEKGYNLVPPYGQPIRPPDEEDSRSVRLPSQK